jgi:hypothetical protein
MKDKFMHIVTMSDSFGHKHTHIYIENNIIGSVNRVLHKTIIIS